MILKVLTSMLLLALGAFFGWLTEGIVEGKFDNIINLFNYPDLEDIDP